MFRQPRENAILRSDERLRPSTGRPPTPPLLKDTPKAYPSPDYTNPVPISKQAMQTPVLGRQTVTRVPSSKKGGIRQSRTILNFFGKADKVDTHDEDNIPEKGLFFEESGVKSVPISTQNSNTLLLEERSPTYTASNDDTSDLRFNEDVTPVKRRRTEVSSQKESFLIRTPSPEPRKTVVNAGSSEIDVTVSQCLKDGGKSQKRIGGFVDESSDEEDNEVQQSEMNDVLNVGDVQVTNSIDNNTSHDAVFDPPGGIWNDFQTVSNSDLPGDEKTFNVDVQDNALPNEAAIPVLQREGTSVFQPGEFGDDDFEDEFNEEGEEYLERRWMEEQREMETMMDEDSKSESGTESVRTPRNHVDDEVDDEAQLDASIAICPICNGDMKGLSESQASSHVNACLDGKALPLPSPVSLTSRPIEPNAGPGTVETVSNPLSTTSSKRFQRSAIARPGQANPFSFAKDGKSGSSAFTRLMSGHAEDAAWAEAASNESQSRGKPAYQRTCPFYKIMPGFFICVDAFRYGKVEGQNAYFLSHFHSDHYIGLTSSWCHGPIYASKVTCNLMRQQLRVEPKWIVPLEFEKKIEVPNTKGVFVTMIPANHCPGSSLYLFEKVIGKNKDGSPRMTRVLHCGDFRACPAHVNHPLLRPEVVDAISGQTRQQVIDTCYLDTTYLTPKYSFPSQYDVIDACAQMCVSMSKEIVDNDDSWEQIKRNRAGSTMTKFLEQGEKEIVKKEEDEDVEEKPKLRGRLLVVIGTYSIGKERICLGIAKALNSKIYAPPGKMRICRCLEDPELNARLTSDPLEAQIHMQTLMEIRAETLHDYLVSYKGHFARVVGFRPTGWSYRPPASRFTENPAVATVLHSDGWKSRFTMRDLAPQRGSTRESNCFGVPYSEHSSFRELTMFCCALRINRIVPTVNVGSARSREKMKGWIEKWETDKRKNGLFKLEVGAEGWGSGDGQLRYGL